MNFALNETQRMLSDTVARYLAREVHQEGFQPAHWEKISELGLLGLSISERYGGLGGSAADVAVVMEELGRGGATTPYAYSVVLAAALLQAGSDAQQERWLADLASGQEHFACALHDAGARHEVLPLSSSAVRRGDSFILSGSKSNVWYGELATQLIVAVQGEGGPMLFVLPADADGLIWKHFKTVDGGSASELRIVDVCVEADRLLGSSESALKAIGMAERRTTAALAAESVGLMTIMLQNTLDYARQRRQFGVVIGSFQALQHRMVDMLIELEQARSLAWYAAASFDSPSAAFQQRAVAAAKARSGRAGRKISQEAIQLHGGMGMAEEVPLARYVRRQLAIENSFGDTAFHVDQFSRIEA